MPNGKKLGRQVTRLSTVPVLIPVNYGLWKGPAQRWEVNVAEVQVSFRHEVRVARRDLLLHHVLCPSCFSVHVALMETGKPRVTGWHGSWTWINRVLLDRPRVAGMREGTSTRAGEICG